MHGLFTLVSFKLFYKILLVLLTTWFFLRQLCMQHIAH